MASLIWKTLTVKIIKIGEFIENPDWPLPPQRTIIKQQSLDTINKPNDVRYHCSIIISYNYWRELEPISEEGWERFRLSGRTLRIKEAQLQDEGSFVCTGVNGFGKDKYTFHLMVLDPLSASSSSSSSGVGGSRSGLAPEFTQLWPPVPGPPLNKPVGHSIKLKCQVSGDPEPMITWFKNGVEVPEAVLSGESRTGSRHSLHLSNLKPGDSGVYTCAAANRLGAAATNWTINVIDQASPREPDFSPLEPKNITVVSGEPAVLQCSGTSEVTPHIKWLRRLEKAAPGMGDKLGNNETITWKGHRYVVVPPTKVATPGDGTFYTKLVVNDVQTDDAGVYVCSATNNFGIAFRQATISVIPGYKENNTMMLVIGIIGVGGLILVIAVIVAVRRHQSKPQPPSGPSESALLPNQSKVPPPVSLQQPRFMPQPATGHPSSQSLPPHGHVVGPEGALLQYPGGGVVHLPPQAAGAAIGQNTQPIIVYQDPAQQVYISQRPPAVPPTGRPEYQYQHLDVI
ncbi:unnamed protein product, partial [Meganyctiphanes norvegica]